MTPNDIFKTAAAYISQSVADSDDLTDFVPMWLNVLLAEALPYENALRVWDGEEALSAAPILTAAEMDTELAWHDDIVRIALPYGLAADFERDDDNNYRDSLFRQKYVAALQDSQRAAAAAIEDVY